MKMNVPLAHITVIEKQLVKTLMVISSANACRDTLEMVLTVQVNT